MAKNKRKTRQYLIATQEELKVAQDSGDEKQISLATAHYGFALFQEKKYPEGLAQFNRSIKLAKDINEPLLQAQCLGLKTLACQNAKRLPEAFKAAQEVEQLADEHQNLGMKCDAKASQAQILLDSGDEISSLPLFNQSLEIAQEIGDKRREMNVVGALGNYSMAVAPGEKAESYFRQARDLAHELGDKQSEIGYQGNLGSIMEWKEDYQEAVKIFTEVLTYMQETNNQEMETQVLRHLVQVYIKQKDDPFIVKYCHLGIKAAKATDDNDNIFYFYENIIPALYRLKQIDEAHQIITDGIKTAHSTNNREKEVDLLLFLGESYMVTNNPEQALETYQKALAGTERLQRMVDKAYLLGRIGMLKAELGYVDEAVDLHKKAIKLAQGYNIPSLEGEQLSMLAMAYMEKGDMEAATTSCQSAIQVFSDAELEEDAEQARQLLKQIE